MEDILPSSSCPPSPQRRRLSVDSSSSTSSSVPNHHHSLRNHHQHHSHPSPATTVASNFTSSKMPSSAQRVPQRHTIPQDHLNICRSILHGLQRHSDAGPFLFPMDPLEWNWSDHPSDPSNSTNHQFPTPPIEQTPHVARPMDLSTVEQLLDDNAYPSVTAFMQDLRLIFENARKIWASPSSTSGPVGTTHNPVTAVGVSSTKRRGSGAGGVAIRKLADGLEAYLDWQVGRLSPDVRSHFTSQPIPSTSSLVSVLQGSPPHTPNDNKNIQQ
ncbi:hypothetical protein BC829DRAFT_248465 [Chytridium lagenaria]|nr:hypothetical protein BC829DRAFT_248465 [Chytridium lagenaria]